MTRGKHEGTMKYLATTIGVVCTLFAINDHPVDSGSEGIEPQAPGTNPSIIPDMPPMRSLVGVVEKWVDARSNAYEYGLAPTVPAFHSLVKFGANQTGGPSGSTTVWEIRNWIPNASGERNLIHTL